MGASGVYSWPGFPHFPPIAEVTLQTSQNGKWVLATVELGDGGQYEHFLLGADGKWIQLTHFEDGITAIGFGEDDALYIDETKNALNGKGCETSARSREAGAGGECESDCAGRQSGH
jgi:hypothetical protein